MSSSITHVEVLNINARMRACDILEFSDNNKYDPPEIYFLEYLCEEARKAPNPNQLIELKYFGWGGIRSSSSYEDLLIKQIAPRIIGTVEAVFTWEDGGSSGLRIRDGQVTECRVVQFLSPKGEIKSESDQELVESLIHYRNLAIKLGAKPEDMRTVYDRELVHNRDIGKMPDPELADGWGCEDTKTIWEENERLSEESGTIKSELLREKIVVKELTEKMKDLQDSVLEMITENSALREEFYRGLNKL